MILVHAQQILQPMIVKMNVVFVEATLLQLHVQMAVVMHHQEIPWIVPVSVALQPLQIKDLLLVLQPVHLAQQQIIIMKIMMGIPLALYIRD